jgi:hypothetical protein
MDADVWPGLVAQMKEHGIGFQPGLTDTEVGSTEASFSFKFPPDLHALLQAALPRGDNFPTWRSGKRSALDEWLDLPRQDILFDIEHADCWLEGKRPVTGRCQAGRTVPQT